MPIISRHIFYNVAKINIRFMSNINSVVDARLPACKIITMITGVGVDAKTASKGASGGTPSAMPKARIVTRATNAPAASAVIITTVAANVTINSATAASTTLNTSNTGSAITVYCK